MFSYYYHTIFNYINNNVLRFYYYSISKIIKIKFIKYIYTKRYLGLRVVLFPGIIKYQWDIVPVYSVTLLKIVTLLFMLEYYKKYNL